MTVIRSASGTRIDCDECPEHTAAPSLALDVWGTPDRRYSNGRRPGVLTGERTAVTAARRAGGSYDSCRWPPQRRQSMPTDSVTSRATAALEYTSPHCAHRSCDGAGASLK